MYNHPSCTRCCPSANTDEHCGRIRHRLKRHEGICGKCFKPISAGEDTVLHDGGYIYHQDCIKRKEPNASPTKASVKP